MDVQNSDTFTSQIHQTLEKWKPDLIVLAGFLRMIPGPVVDRYPQQIINIHPSLLPKYGGKGFYGINVHRAVVNAGEQTSGYTGHFVDNEDANEDIIVIVEVAVFPD